MRHKRRSKRRPVRRKGSSTNTAMVVCVIIVIALFVLSFIFPMIYNGKTKGDLSPTQPTEDNTLENEESYPPKANEKSDEETISFYNTQSQALESITIRDYLLGAVAAEMPAAYEIEALKAQAVASRSLIYYKMGRGGCSRHEGAHICGDFGHCQAYSGDAKLKEVFGTGYDGYKSKILQAIDETAGCVMVYNGEVIEALFHSMAGGMTEDSQHVFGGSVDYLKAVESPGEESNAKYKTQKTVSKDAFINTVVKAYPKANKSLGVENGIKIISRYESGRVNKCSLLGVELTGVQVRKLFSLPSANFTFSVQDDGVTIHNTGSGHGVGMSQVGANAMAKAGNNYADILQHYYKGASLLKMDELE
jgi:stage II sporulation protein D